MTDLLETVIEAHGGLTRWTRLETVSARLVQGGALWSLKGQQGVLDDVFVTASLHEERVSHHPFGAPDRRSAFTPERVAIMADNGTIGRGTRPAPGLVRGSHARDAVDHSSAGILRRHRDVDLPYAALHIRPSGIQDD
jgi:hypothetical protein